MTFFSIFFFLTSTSYRPDLLFAVTLSQINACSFHAKPALLSSLCYVLENCSFGLLPSRVRHRTKTIQSTAWEIPGRSKKRIFSVHTNRIEIKSLFHKYLLRTVA